MRLGGCGRRAIGEVGEGGDDGLGESVRGDGSKGDEEVGDEGEDDGKQEESEEEPEVLEGEDSMGWREKEGDIGMGGREVVEVLGQCAQGGVEESEIWEGGEGES